MFQVLFWQFFFFGGVCGRDVQFHSRCSDGLKHVDITRMTIRHLHTHMYIHVSKMYTHIFTYSTHIWRERMSFESYFFYPRNWFCSSCQLWYWRRSTSKNGRLWLMTLSTLVDTLLGKKWRRLLTLKKRATRRELCSKLLCAFCVPFLGCFEGLFFLKMGFKLMVHCWFGLVVWIPGIPLWKGLLGVPLESQTTGPHTNS